MELGIDYDYALRLWGIYPVGSYEALDYCKTKAEALERLAELQAELNGVK